MVLEIVLVSIRVKVKALCVFPPNNSCASCGHCKQFFREVWANVCEKRIELIYYCYWICYNFASFFEKGKERFIRFTATNSTKPSGEYTHSIP